MSSPVDAATTTVGARVHLTDISPRRPRSLVVMTARRDERSLRDRCHAVMSWMRQWTEPFRGVASAPIPTDWSMRAGRPNAGVGLALRRRPMSGQPDIGGGGRCDHRLPMPSSVLVVDDDPVFRDLASSRSTNCPTRRSSASWERLAGPAAGPATVLLRADGDAVSTGRPAPTVRSRLSDGRPFSDPYRAGSTTDTPRVVRPVRLPTCGAART